MSSIQVKTELSFEELLKSVAQLNAADLEQLLAQVIVLQALQAQQPSFNQSDQEQEDWETLSTAGLAAAYSEDEIDYSLNLIKIPNSEYDGAPL